MEQLQKQAAEMLEGGHIAFFVYVDDKFGSNLIGKEEAKIYVSQHLNDVDFITDQHIWEELFENWWKSAPERVKQELFNSWGLLADNADYLKDKFDQILPGNIERHYLSPEQFSRQKEALFSQLDKDHQLLILVDRSLGDYGRDGTAILEQISQKNFINCAVFSGTFHIEDEIKEWNSSHDKANIYSISKDRLSSNNDIDILEGIRNVLWLKQISMIKKHAKTIVEEAAKFMGEHIDIIDPSTFHRVVLDRSESEGCWEFETMLRIVQAYMNMGMKKNMLENGYNDFQLMTSALRAIKNAAQANRSDQMIINEISSVEVYESQSYINNTFSQLCNGDIFRIGRDVKKDYILLCQPCNLVIRSNGCRSRREFDQAFLIPIREFKKDDDRNKLVEELQPVEGEPRMVAELSHYVRVSLSILDLVSYNDQGKAIINVSQTIDNHPYRHIIQKNMMMRYTMILNKILSYKGNYEKIIATDLSDEDKVKLKKAFCRPFEMGDEIVAKQPRPAPNNINEIDFFITRIRRYKDPYASDLLGLFMNCLSRPAYPMGLDR